MRLLLPTGLLVGTLGASLMLVQAVGAIEGTTGQRISAEGVDAPAWVSVEAAGLEREPLRPEGLTPQGTINPEQGQAIWYVGSDRVVPGQVGTAVLAAHETYYDQPDVFSDLGEVTEGDLVTIGYGNGTTREFLITSTQQLSKEGLQHAPDVWGDQRDVARVALITCDDSLGSTDDGRSRANFVAIAEAKAQA